MNGLYSVWRVFPEYSASNTILLDDEYEKCSSNPPENCLVVTEKGRPLLSPDGPLRRYLKQLANSSDCAQYAWEHPSFHVFPQELRSDNVAFKPVLREVNVPPLLSQSQENKMKIELFQRLADSGFFQNDADMSRYILWTLGLKDQENHPNFDGLQETVTASVRGQSLKGILDCILKIMDSGIRGTEKKVESFLRHMPVDEA